MLRWLFRARLDAFDRKYGYDSSYVREIVDADLGAALKLTGVMGLEKHRKGVPIAPWYAAKLASTLAEDCGPCTQLVVNMAQQDGVAPEVLRAIVSGDIDALPEDVALALRYAQAVIRRDAECGPLRERVVAAWGKQGLISLAIALTMGRFFPTLKYAMGHGLACSRVKVGEALVSVNHEQPA
jgi:hypothetical protein